MLLGYALLHSVYFLLVGALAGWALLAASLGLLGVYDAATDGVLMALGSGVEPEEVRGQRPRAPAHGHQRQPPARVDLLRRPVDAVGITAAFTCFGVALLAAGALSGLLLVRTPEPVEVVQALPR